MGQNLVLNFRDKGYRVAVYNRSIGVTRDFVARSVESTAPQILGCDTLAELIGKLARPRKVLLIVKAGDPVDAVIAELRGLLSPGDIIVDLGNSHYLDSERRGEELDRDGLRHVGCGISGGEEGARWGPALMPGGDVTAWSALEAMLTAIAARADGEPCVSWVGPGGAGHFVKMVHNGIEYGDMQLICEAYDLLRRGLGLSHREIAERFRAWNAGPLKSYLIEITGNILARLDADGTPSVERILDRAGQKGTGTWSGIEALRLGVPASLIGEAVFARALSARKAERGRASQLLQGPGAGASLEPAGVPEALEQALYAAKIVSYAQGFMLMQAASEERDWELGLARIAGTWRAGCIIRSPFLEEIMSVYADGDPGNIMLAPFFRDALAGAQPSWRRVVSLGAESGIPMPAFFSALSFYDGFRSERLPANLLQAQRDYFGAHGYERVDRPGGERFHTEWEQTPE